MREQLFQQLELLYSRLDSELASSGSESNSCGRCRECCTGQGLSLHNVTELELEYLAGRVGGEKIEEFRKFARRDGTIALCPYFDETIWGCGVYSVRPFSCRLFGHYRREDQFMPPVCVFAGQEKIFACGAYYREVPEAVSLRDLVRRFWPYRRAREDTQAFASGTPALEEGEDALDRALALQAQGRLQEALETLAQSELEEIPYVMYCLALILEGLGFHEEALRALRQALEEVPELPLLRFREACNLVALKRFDEAVTVLDALFAEDPVHSDAGALLAGCYFTLGKMEQARAVLLAVLEQAPGHPSAMRMLPLVEQEFRRRNRQL